MTTLEPRTNLRPNVSFSLPEFGSTPTNDSRTAPGTLTETVRNTVRGVAENTLRPVTRRDSGVAHQPRVLLALLTYCYARGIYGSTDIERVMHKDKLFRALCREEFPDARMLRRFRRENRPALQSSLSLVLRLAAPNAEKGRAEESWNAEQSAEEALRRLDMAACMDTLDMET
jgi:transposase